MLAFFDGNVIIIEDKIVTRECDYQKPVNLLNKSN